MDKHTLKLLLSTRTIRLLILFGLLYFIGFFVFFYWVDKIPNKVPGQSQNIFRDFIWIIYWRWYLDWPIILGFIGIGSLLASFFQALGKRLKTSLISTYIFPLTIMLANYIGMLAIDIAITWFADFYINGTWMSVEILLFGMTAQRLYHGFFFWYMPALLIIGIPINNIIHTKKYKDYFQSQFVFLAGFSWCLGFLDPVVCQVIWGDWKVFGEWAMMGYDPMFACGWVTHYFIFGVLWLFAVKIVNKTLQELTKTNPNQIINENSF